MLILYWERIGHYSKYRIGKQKNRIGQACRDKQLITHENELDNLMINIS